jgi:hypothetical protein
MVAPASNLQWKERVAELSAESAAADREAAARLTVSERLERGLALSMFAARMREAFRSQSRAS